MEPVQPVEMNIYQSNTYRKDLCWLHFGNESRVQERQQWKDLQSCTRFCNLSNNSKERAIRLALEGKASKEIPESSRLEFLEMFLAILLYQMQKSTPLHC